MGAHKDMDYDVMRKGIAAIRPYFPRMAMAATPEELREAPGISEKDAAEVFRHFRGDNGKQ